MIEIGTHREIDFPMQKGDSQLWYEVRVIPEFDSAGRVATAMCIARFSSACVVRFACTSMRPDAEGLVIKTCGAPNHFALAEHTLGARAESR